MASIYKTFKNHLHNTLAITKDDIRGMVEKAVDKVVERKIEVMFRSHYGTSEEHFKRYIDSVIAKKYDWNGFWRESEDNLDDHIKQEVVRQLMRDVKLKVDVVHSDKEKTSPGKIAYMNVVRTRKPKIQKPPQGTS